MKPRNIFVSWDMAAAGAVALSLSLGLPPELRNDFCKDLYGIGISVLSIVFSLYAAALALLMTSPDDEFVRFLEEESQYMELVSSFKFVLVVLFLALGVSIAWYALTGYWISEHWPDIATQTKWWMVTFAPLAVYALCATLLSMVDSIHYSKRRIEFLKIPKRGDRKRSAS
jgi:hypothetical protein